MRQILYRNYLWSRHFGLLAAGVSLLCAAAYASTPIVLDYNYTNGNRLGQIVLISDDDEDALHNRLEELGCTDPNDADTDDDGIGDGVEDANLNGQTNPTETNPCMADTDGDSLQDGAELGYTYKEVSFDTDLKIFRPDNDPTTHTSAILADSDGDGFTDGQEDKNHNGRVDPGENNPNQITTTNDFLWGPAWWYVRGVISTNAGKPKNDYAAITQGQLKWMALQAHAEFAEQLQTNGGAGAALDQLVAGFSTNANNNTVVNQGQLKNMVKPFYDRLWELGLTNAYPPGVTGRYPWDNVTNPPSHDSLANIGQAKRLFCFYLNDSPLVPPMPVGMSLIPAGAFQMGDFFPERYSGALPLHTVTIRAFYMDQCEVSKAKWDEVYTWATAHGYNFSNAGSVGTGKDANYPVHTINWYDCVKWANARSEKEGLLTCYSISGNVYRIGESVPDCNWSADGYRLPTEAEWEKAARGGAVGCRFSWSDSDTIQLAGANYYSDADYAYDTSSTRGFHPLYNTSWATPYTSPVGVFAPNRYGLYDMTGNLNEWCWDGYDESYYASSPGTDPRGPVSGSSRVNRGGSWTDFPYGCCVAYRHAASPNGSGRMLGFRLVRTAQ